MTDIKKIMLDTEGRKFYLRDISKDFHTDKGIVLKKDLKKKGRIESSKGHEFFIFDAGFIDRFRKIKRGAQIITLKDAGCIIAETGVSKESKVLEAGGGSGGLTVVLGNICKEVISYEIKKSFYKIVKENIAGMGLDNVKVRNKDISEGITERNLDLIVLDMPDVSEVIMHAANSLKKGGFLVTYLPSMTQVIESAKKISDCGNFIMVKTVENIQREWKIDGKIARPEFRMLGHTGFLGFYRKI